VRAPPLRRRLTSRVTSPACRGLAAWLTTVVARISLNTLRSRNARREQPFAAHMSAVDASSRWTSWPIRSA
jgi:hypothetical protein